MLDFAITTAVLYLPIAALALAVRRETPPRSQRLTLTILALAVTLVNGIVVLGGMAVQQQLPFFSALEWNWPGKIAAVIATLAMMRCLPGATRGEMGLTWKAMPGSVVPAMIAAVALCAFSWTLQAALTGPSPIEPERLAYQALMPGLDEELFFRGLLLAVLIRAFGAGPSLAGAPIGWAAIAVTFLFAAGHGFRIIPDGVQFSALAVAVTGVIGFGLVWIRQRTGTLLAPILAHNIINLGNGFF